MVKGRLFDRRICNTVQFYRHHISEKGWIHWNSKPVIHYISLSCFSLISFLACYPVDISLSLIDCLQMVFLKWKDLFAHGHILLFSWVIFISHYRRNGRKYCIFHLTYLKMVLDFFPTYFFNYLDCLKLKIF